MDYAIFSRISALSRIAVCPASAAESDEHPSVQSDATARGHAGHEWLQHHAPDKAANTIRDLARKHQCNLADLTTLVDASDFAPGGEPSKTFREHPVELVIPGDAYHPNIIVAGTLDWMTISGAGAEMWDYKFSLHPEFNIGVDRDAQWHGYAVAIADKYELAQVTGGKYYPILGENGYERITLNKEALDKAREWLTFIVRRAWRTSQLPAAKREYRPNQWDWSTGCKGCRGIVSCDAAWQAQEAALALIGRDPKAVRRDLDIGAVVDLYEARSKASATVRASAELGKVLLAYVDEHGPVSIDEHREIRVMEQKNGKRFVRALKKET